MGLHVSSCRVGSMSAVHPELSGGLMVVAKKTELDYIMVSSGSCAFLTSTASELGMGY